MDMMNAPRSLHRSAGRFFAGKCGAQALTLPRLLAVL